MPIYEFKCEACGNCFEQLVFVGDREKITCPQCGKTKVQKQISCASFFGDSGFDKCASGSSSGFS